MAFLQVSKRRLISAPCLGVTRKRSLTVSKRPCLLWTHTTTHNTRSRRCHFRSCALTHTSRRVSVERLLHRRNGCHVACFRGLSLWFPGSRRRVVNPVTTKPLHKFSRWKRVWWSPVEQSIVGPERLGSSAWKGATARVLVRPQPTRAYFTSHLFSMLLCVHK